MTAAISELKSKPIALSQKRAAASLATTTTLIALVARKRSISRHLAFIDLEPPATAQLYDVVLPDGFRLEPDALVLPDYCSLALNDLHLTMGGALTERLGGEDSAQVMSQIRAGQIVLVTATFDAAENAMVCLDCVILAEPVLEGWEAGVWVGTGDADQYLQLDIADESIVLVDDATKLSAMSKHLHTATASATVIGLDCEWQPARIKGDRSPASLLQLAVDNTVYVIDLLRCCRTELFAGAELSATEQLLNDALSTLLSSAEVIKTGLQPRNDLLQLSRTYKHMPCFSRFDGVVDLFQLGTHAVSLGAVMRNDRSSLSKLSEIVLGKRLNKAEQAMQSTVFNTFNIVLMIYIYKPLFWLYDSILHMQL
jgi:3'-5' exonuclease